MDCSNVRDRFSALWDKELDPSEERRVRDHLSRCPECREDFVRFERTLRRLHSVDEMEVPEDFLSGVYEKLEARKKGTLSGGTPRLKWIGVLAPMKLPIQAVAMVAVVFLALYLSKTGPVESPLLKAPEKGKSRSLQKEEAVQERRSPADAVKKMEGGPSPRPSAPLPEEAGRGKVSSSPGKKMDVLALAEKRRQEKGLERSFQESKTVPTEEPSRKEQEVPGPPLLKEKKGEEVLPMAGAGAAAEGKPSEKMILTVSDREEAFSRIVELARKFGGEVSSAEVNRLFVSVPSDSYKEMEKSLADLGSSGKAGRAPSQRLARPGLSASPERKKLKPGSRDEGAKRPQPGGASRITFEVVLVLE